MGCDIGAATPRVVVEIEQKFLVDLREFEAVRGKLRRRHVRQCYVAVQGEGDGWEARYREVRCDAADLGPCDLCRKKPGRCWNCGVARDEHPCHHCIAGRRIKAATTEHTCTLKRRRYDSAIARDEIEFTVSPAAFDAVWAASSWRVEKDRYDGAAIGNWTVDVFTSGPLQDVAVAELEMPSDFRGDVEAFLDGRWPGWLATESWHRPIPVDLTVERVNLVAAGVIEKSARLRRLRGEADGPMRSSLGGGQGGEGHLR